MKVLEEILAQRLFERERSYTRKLSISFQPGSIADFGNHSDFDELFDKFTKGDPYRGMDMARLWSIILNIKARLPRTSGSVAELGVYKGHTSAVLSHFAELFGRRMYLLDTFSGFDAADLDEEIDENRRQAFRDSSVFEARSIVGEYKGNRWVVGKFPESATDEMRHDTYSFVSLDCDLYEPIKAGLDFFYQRLAPNGVIFVHDYSSGYWPGVKRAVDEFLESRKVPGVLLPDVSGSIVVGRG